MKKIRSVLLAAPLVAACYFLGMVGGAVWNVSRPHESKVRSPERGDGPVLGTLEIPEGNPFFRRVTKTIRAAPPFHWLWGWKEWSKSECAVGTIGAPRVSDDGDVVFDLYLGEWSWDLTKLMDVSEIQSADPAIFDYIHCEIPYEYRGDFPILPDLREGLKLRVCGRFVWDRAWGHNEFHPVWWIGLR